MLPEEDEIMTGKHVQKTVRKTALKNSLVFKNKKKAPPRKIQGRNTCYHFALYIQDMQGVIFNRSLAIKQKVENGVAALLHAKGCFVHDLESLSHCSSSGLPVFYFYVFFFEKMELKILDFSSAGAVDARLLPPALVAPPTKKTHENLVNIIEIIWRTCEHI